jgi:hypothetical protein
MMADGKAGGSGASVDLAEVVAGGKQSPLAAGAVLAAQEEMAAVLAGHDLTADGLDDGLAAAVGGLAGLAPQLAGPSVPLSVALAGIRPRGAGGICSSWVRRPVDKNVSVPQAS